SVGERKPSNWAKLLEMRLPAAFVPFDTDRPIPSLAADHAAAEREEPVVVARPSITDQHDSAVNVTSLTLFAQCPRKYYLQRYIGWTGARIRSFDPEDSFEENSDETPAAELGSFVH